MSDNFNPIEDNEENIDFPIHHVDTVHCLKVYTNPTGELFIENTQSGVKMRVNSSQRGELEFTTYGRVDPVYVNGMIGWCIHYP